MISNRSIMIQNSASDDFISGIVNFLVRGMVLIFSGPILLFIYSKSLLKNRCTNYEKNKLLLLLPIIALSILGSSLTAHAATHFYTVKLQNASSHYELPVGFGEDDGDGNIAWPVQ